jgi:hypothetical protein
MPPLYQHAGHLLQFDDEGRVSSKEAHRAGGVHGGGAFEASEASTAGAMLRSLQKNQPTGQFSTAMS